MGPTLVWFRRDLRLNDNPALDSALRLGAPVLPLYVLDDTPGLRPMGAASRWWLNKSLSALENDLRDLGLRLILRRGHAADIILDLAKSETIENVVFNAVFDPRYDARDRHLAQALGAKGVVARRFNGGNLVKPEQVRTQAGGSFSVFTPFWRATRTLVDAAPNGLVLAAIAPPSNWPESDQLSDWDLHPTAPDWSAGFADWNPGEAGARANLEFFVDQALATYANDRDLPGIEGTSRLSPHLHFGEVSPKACWRAAEAARGSVPDSQVDKFLSELGWREFSTNLVAREGDLARDNFDSRFDRFPWRDAPADLAAWQRGQTGYPIVDAGMRQLWATGWMHNRVRMVCASFLTKHLLIDWRLGEAWFWDTLVDADHAANAANWQWVAGSGADAAPYFRIFNPVLQGQKFDAGGDYVRRWVPELTELPMRYLHAPWTAPAPVLQASGIELGRQYPKPVVDHALARQRALEAYGSMRGRESGADVIGHGQ